MRLGEGSQAQTAARAAAMGPALTDLAVATLAGGEDFVIEVLVILYLVITP